MSSSEWESKVSNLQKQVDELKVLKSPAVEVRSLDSAAASMASRPSIIRPKSCVFLGDGSSDMPAVASQPPSTAAKLALIGAGRWSRGWHLPQLDANPNAKIAALASGRKVPELAVKYGCPGFKDVDELLASDVVKTLDGVIIASPHANHFEIGMKCISAGLNIFMEKPMTTDLKQAQELTKAANALGKVFMVNNTANWRKSTQLATEMVARGDIGEVKHASLFFATPLGFLFEDPAQKGWVEPEGSMLGNGFGWGQMAHTFGWFFMVSGLVPETVFTFMGKSDKSGADVYDAVTIRCTNGATVTASGIASIPGNAKHVQNRLVGTQGMLSYCGYYQIDEGEGAKDAGGEHDVAGELVLTRFDGKNTTVPGFEYENIEQAGIGPESMLAFIDACQGKPYFKGATADIGLFSVATISAMYASAHSGKAEPAFP